MLENMSVSSSFRCLVAKPAAPARSCLRRAFTSSPSLRARPAPRFPNLKASKKGMGKKTKFSAADFGPYTDTDKAALSDIYTPAQVAAIEAGEASVDPGDLAKQGTIRDDPFALQYIDDLSMIHPVVDKPVRAPKSNYDPNLRYKDEDEIAEDFAQYFQNAPADADAEHFEKHMADMRITVGKEEAERNPRSYLAPEIPKLDSLAPKASAIDDDKEEIDPGVQRLMRQTGFTVDQIRGFRVKNLVFHRVVNQTRLGKISSLYYLTVAGNGRGLLGIGEGKSSEPDDARTQAAFAAIRNLQPIARYEDRTIYGDVKVKIGAVELELMTRPPGKLPLYPHDNKMLIKAAGFGIRCQSNIYEMCRCAGIQDLAARVTRSRNPMNTIKATLQALLRQRIPEDIARARGKKLVDVRKVYYGGFV